MKSLKEFIDLAKKISKSKIEYGSSGNVSIRIGKSQIIIKPTGIPYEKINKTNLALVDSNGRLLKGLKPSSDLQAHLEIYKKRKDINCIIHTHSHYATVFAILGRPLKILSTFHADYFGKEIKCLPYVNHRIENFGIDVANCKEKVFLLGNHGAIILGNSAKEAFKLFIALEEIAKLNYHCISYAEAKGLRLRKINHRDAEIMHNYYWGEYGQIM
ncbi:class II aldolase/adducin family protein [Candidatus Woesearchaeota archaeon]|nr:class II aldolase/adducin family protein [Candidatus Woesearchaeota archaeon]